MDQELHENRELHKRVCQLYWDIHNVPELGDLSPSLSHPTAIQYSSFVLAIITCIIGFIGNLLVIFVTGFLKKKSKSQIWFLNLAVADFSFLLFLPLQAVSVLTARWPYGPNMCKFYNFITFVNMYASIYILTALNIDRTLSVAKPIWHQRFLSRKFGYSICLLIWVLSAVCSFPAIVYSDQVLTGEEPQCFLFSNDITSLVYSNIDRNASINQEWKSLPRELCDIPFENVEKFKLWVEMQSTTMTLVVPLAVIGCIIPLCVILASNIIIIHHVKKSKVPSSSRLYGVVIAAILVFFCTRTPLLLAQIILLVSAHTMEFTLMYKVIVFFPLLSSIAATNTFLNPVVYVLVGKKVREEISHFLSKI